MMESKRSKEIKIEDMDDIHLRDICSIEQAGVQAQGWSYDSFQRELDKYYARCRVIKVDGVVAGFYVSWFISGEIELANIAVSTDYRRMGLGDQLMDDLIDYGKKMAFQKIYLEVRNHNQRAVPLYENKGFEQIAIRKNYYSDGEDAKVMALNL